MKQTASIASDIDTKIYSWVLEYQKRNPARWHALMKLRDSATESLPRNGRRNNEVAMAIAAEGLHRIAEFGAYECFKKHPETVMEIVAATGLLKSAGNHYPSLGAESKSALALQVVELDLANELVPLLSQRLRKMGAKEVFDHDFIRVLESSIETHEDALAHMIHHAKPNDAIYYMLEALLSANMSNSASHALQKLYKDGAGMDIEAIKNLLVIVKEEFNIKEDCKRLNVANTLIDALEIMRRNIPVNGNPEGLKAIQTSLIDMHDQFTRTLGAYNIVARYSQQSQVERA